MKEPSIQTPFDPSKLIVHVRALSDDIGPRGTGTAEEAQAAAYVHSHLQALGISELERQHFRAVTSQNYFPLTVGALSLLALLIYPLIPPLSRWVAAVMAGLAAPLLSQTIRTADSPFRALMPQRRSQNVIARLPPTQDARRRAVLLAHLDTNRCRMAWQARGLSLAEPLVFVTLGIYGLNGSLYLIGALGGPPIVYPLSFIPAAYIFSTLIVLLLDDRNPYSPGANDNASGVAVALELAELFQRCPLERTEVWIAFTGAEETDHAGLKTLLKREGGVLREAHFIDLEGVGGGEIVYLVRQGIGFKYRPDPQLVALAERVTARHPELAVRAAEMAAVDEVATLRRLGYRALCVSGRDPETGTLLNWHRSTDTWERLSSQALLTAATFVLDLLLEIDFMI